LANQLFSVCVFCGSRDGNRPEYRQAAADFGQIIAQEGWRLVFGAGDVGIMGAVAHRVESAGGKTLGVIPVHLLARESAGRDLSECIVTEDMHERKKVMFMNSDAVVVLPGGAGSLDELFEVLTWAQLGLHAKPIILVNVNGYWDRVVELIDHVIEEGFADASLRDYITVEPDVVRAATALRDWRS